MGASAMNRRQPEPITFMRGRRLYQIAKAREGSGFVGYRDGRQIVRGAEKAEVARTLIRSVQCGRELAEVVKNFR